jgi:hypothetical protein
MMEEKSNTEFKSIMNGCEGDPSTRERFDHVFSSIDTHDVQEVIIEPHVRDSAKIAGDGQVISRLEVAETTWAWQDNQKLTDKKAELKPAQNWASNEPIANSQPDVDFEFALLNRTSGLKEDLPNSNIMNLDWPGRITRNPSLLRLDPENTPRTVELTPLVISPYANFSGLFEFLMRFFKSQPIFQEDLNLKPPELCILRSFISRKYNRSISEK